MKVRAKEFGIYRGDRIRAGVVFELVGNDKPAAWMQPVDDNARTILPRGKDPRPTALSEMTPKGAALPGTAPSSKKKLDTGDLLR